MKKYFLTITALCFISVSSIKAQVEFWGTALKNGPQGIGTIFKTNYDGTGFTVMHTFENSAMGEEPGGDLIEATNGKYYGYTYAGGECGHGTMFEYDLATNAYTVLVNFDLHTNGASPNGYPIQASNGLLYGMTADGGPASGGTIFSYDITSQTFTLLSDFAGLGYGPTESGSFVQATNGKLYALGMGGPSGNGVIFEFDIAVGSPVMLYNFPGSALDGSEPWGGLMQATNGKLYGVTGYGGVNDYGVLFEYDIPTSTFTKHFDFTNASGRYPFGTLMQASNGLIYGMANEAGGASSGTLFEFDPVNITVNPVIDFDGIIGDYPWYGTVAEGSNGKLYGLTAMGGVNFMGTLFEYDPVSGLAVSKIDFSGPDGNWPMGGLLHASNGKMYGMTSGGGVQALGNIFEYDYINSIFTNKIDMNAAPDGGYPTGGLTLAPNGKLYGVTHRGGSANMGVIYEMDPSNGQYSVAAEFNGTNGGFLDEYSPPGGMSLQMCLASNGKMYGANDMGGSNGDGAIFEFDPATFALTSVAEFQSSTTGNNPGGGLIQAADGKLYGVTQFGGTNSMGTLFSFDIGSGILTAVFQFDGIKGANPNCILSELAPGSIYGVARLGGNTNDGTIFLYDISAGTTTKLNDFVPSDGTGSGTIYPASNGSFYLMLTKDGANGQGTLSTYDTTTHVLTKLIDFSGTVGGTNFTPGLLTENNGKIYALREMAGPDYNGNLYEFDPAVGVENELTLFGCATGTRPMSTTLTRVDNSAGSAVWPGDCNFDQIVNNVDFLNIGLAYNETGIVRPGASNNWTAQPSAAWTNSFVTSVNHKHADANGDGNVNMSDTVAISLNYGQSHPLRVSHPQTSGGGTDITLLPNPLAIAPGQGVDFDIHLGYSTPPPDSLYGIAFTLSFDPLLVDASQTSLNWSPSILGTLGTNMQAFSRYNSSQGTIEIALTRVDHTDLVNTSGVLGKLHLQALTGISQITPLQVTPGSITGITTGEQIKNFVPVFGETTIDPALIGIAENTTSSGIYVYPNPAQTSLNIRLDNEQSGTLKIFDIKGVTIYNNSFLTSSLQLDISTWSKGVYVIEWISGSNVIHKEVVVR